MQPYESHFHPVRGPPVAGKADSRRLGQPLAAINIVPYSDQVCLRAAPRFYDNLVSFSSFRRIYWTPGTTFSANSSSRNRPHSKKRSRTSLAELCIPHFSLLIMRRRALGPGADSLTRVLTNSELPAEQRVDVTQKVRDLTVADWALVVRAFDNWPFAPEVRRSVYLFVSWLNVGFGLEPDHFRRVHGPKP